MITGIYKNLTAYLVGGWSACTLHVQRAACTALGKLVIVYRYYMRPKLLMTGAAARAQIRKMWHAFPIRFLQRECGDYSERTSTYYHRLDPQPEALQQLFSRKGPNGLVALPFSASKLSIYLSLIVVTIANQGTKA